jgi:hypothetical protein
MDEASVAFADALERNEPDVAKRVHLYALVSRMRVLSSERVVEQADAGMRTIMETYRGPNRSLRESPREPNLARWIPCVPSAMPAARNDGRSSPAASSARRRQGEVATRSGPASELA